MRERSCAGVGVQLSWAMSLYTDKFPSSACAELLTFLCDRAQPCAFVRLALAFYSIHAPALLAAKSFDALDRALTHAERATGATGTASALVAAARSLLLDNMHCAALRQHIGSNARMLAQRAERVSSLRALFREADPQCTGSLSRGQFLALFRRCLDVDERSSPSTPGASPSAGPDGAIDGSPPPLRAARSERIRLYDTDVNAEIGEMLRDEFIDGWVSELVSELFDAVDATSSGSISFDAFVRASRVLAPALGAILGAVPSHTAGAPSSGSLLAVGVAADGRVRVLFDHFDLDSDGVLSIPELSALVCTIYHAQRALQYHEAPNRLMRPRTWSSSAAADSTSAANCDRARLQAEVSHILALVAPPSMGAQAVATAVLAAAGLTFSMFEVACRRSVVLALGLSLMFTVTDKDLSAKMRSLSGNHMLPANSVVVSAIGTGLAAKLVRASDARDFVFDVCEIAMAPSGSAAESVVRLVFRRADALSSELPPICRSFAEVCELATELGTLGLSCEAIADVQHLLRLPPLVDAAARPRFLAEAEAEVDAAVRARLERFFALVEQSAATDNRPFAKAVLRFVGEADAAADEPQQLFELRAYWLRFTGAARRMEREPMSFEDYVEAADAHDLSSDRERLRRAVRRESRVVRSPAAVSVKLARSCERVLLGLLGRSANVGGAFSLVGVPSIVTALLCVLGRDHPSAAESAAFWVFCSLAEDVVSGFFTPDAWALQVTLKVLDVLISREFPALFVHCERVGLSTTLFTEAWLSTLFCGRLPALTALQLLEFIAHPSAHKTALIRLTLALLRLSQDELLGTEEPEDFHAVLVRLESTVTATELLRVATHDVVIDEAKVAMMLQDGQRLMMSKARREMLR
jgi:hypothetical protein